MKYIYSQTKSNNNKAKFPAHSLRRPIMHFKISSRSQLMMSTKAIFFSQRTQRHTKDTKLDVGNALLCSLCA